MYVCMCVRVYVHLFMCVRRYVDMSTHTCIPTYITSYIHTLSRGCPRLGPRRGPKSETEPVSPRHANAGWRNSPTQARARTHFCLRTRMKAADASAHPSVCLSYGLSTTRRACAHVMFHDMAARRTQALRNMAMTTSHYHAI